MEAQTVKLTCPECESSKIYNNGHRQRKNGLDVQRYICAVCGASFLENYNRLPKTIVNRQISAKTVKNLTNITETKTVMVDLKDNLNGKVIDYLNMMNRQGFAYATRKLNATCLKILVERGAVLSDPETVKDVLAKQSNKDTANKNKIWSSSRKRNMINAYTQFLKFIGQTWEAPKNVVTRKIPFIPSEHEIDDLIAGTPKTVATMLQLLKETAMRSGEAIRLKWKDVDVERKVIFCNDPEKGSNPRVFGKISDKLLTMLCQMPKNNEYVFGETTINSIKNTFGRSRKRLSFKLGNPRLLEIHFHTLRHWKATIEYHYTKDVLHVKQFLGHKDVMNTELYISLDKQLFQNIPDDKFITKVAHNTAECCNLIEVGFEYHTGTFEDGGKIFRKRK